MACRVHDLGPQNIWCRGLKVDPIVKTDFMPQSVTTAPPLLGLILPLTREQRRHPKDPDAARESSLK